MMRAFLLTVMLLAAPAIAQPAAAPTAQPAAAPVPVPETRSCLPMPQIRGSDVVDGRTIDFRLRDGSVWRNRLPRSCPGLGFDRAFSYTTSIPQLCNVDIIRVIVLANPGLIGSTCGLGQFERQPPKPVKNR